VVVFLSFLLDPPALLLVGFLAGQVYHLAVVFGDRIITRGPSRRKLRIFGVAAVVIFWAYSALLYLNVIYFPWPFPRWYGGMEWMLNSGLPLGLTHTPSADVIAVVIFATYPLWFYFGTKIGLPGARLSSTGRNKERSRIIKALVATAFPEGGAIAPGAAGVGAADFVEKLLSEVPPLYSDSLSLLFFVFDSRFFVLAFTGRWKRFVDLDSVEGSTYEKGRYLEAWESNPFLLNVCQALRIIASFGYYTRPEVYRLMNYSGPMIPNLPPWYNPGPGTVATGEAGGP